MLPTEIPTSLTGVCLFTSSPGTSAQPAEVCRTMSPKRFSSYGLVVQPRLVVDAFADLLRGYSFPLISDVGKG